MEQTQTHPKPDMIPRALIRALLALVLSVLAIVTFARLTDQPLSATPPQSPVAQERSLILSTNDLSGAARVFGADGTLLISLDPEEGGFIAGVARVLERERNKARVAQNTPITLTRGTNGRLSIHDPSTGWRADLMGFGADNAKAFARLLALN